MEKFKAVLVGLLLIILIPVAHGILSTIGNVIVDFLVTFWDWQRTGEWALNMGTTRFLPFLASSWMSYVIIFYAAFEFFPKSRIYYAIGISLNIVLVIWGMVDQGYPWYYYTETIIGVACIFIDKDSFKT